MGLGNRQVFAIDTETTGVDPETDSLLEVAITTPYRLRDFETLVSYMEKIPSEAKAVHHITERAVQASSVPSRSEVIKHIKGMLSSIEDRVIVAHNAQFDRAFLPEFKDEQWVCTQRMAKRLHPELPSHGLQYLRYELDIITEPKGWPHQAMYDAEVCLDLFEVLHEKAVSEDPTLASASALVKWCWEPIRLLICPLGKHKGQTFEWIAQNDIRYLGWMFDTSNKDDCDWDEDLTNTIHYWYTEG